MVHGRSTTLIGSLFSHFVFGILLYKISSILTLFTLYDISLPLPLPIFRASPLIALLFGHLQSVIREILNKTFMVNELKI